MAPLLLGRCAINVMQQPNSISLSSKRQQAPISSVGKRPTFTTTAQRGTLRGVHSSTAAASHSPRHSALYYHSGTVQTCTGCLQHATGLNPCVTTSSRRLSTARCPAVHPSASSTRGVPEQQQQQQQQPARETISAAAQDSSQQAHSADRPGPQQQQWELVSRSGLAGGVLEVVHWEGDRNIRVWLPPGVFGCMQCVWLMG
jgi:hypothetical protein